MARLQDVILRDTRANQPAATAVAVGTLFCVQDENDIVERSNGTTWDPFSPTGSGSGDVVGPASSVDSEIALFDGTTGKLIKSATGSGIVRVSSGVYGTPGAVDLTSEVTGALPIANGGTGQTAQTAAFDALAPTTTKGDVIVHNGTDNIRLAVGTNGQVLTADSAEASGVKWAAGGGGGNSTSATAIGSEPGSPTTGDLDLYTNSFYIARYSGSAWVPWGPIYPMTAPVNGDFSWVNEGSATVATTNGGILLSTPAEAASNIHLRVKSAPSTPYTIIGRFLRSGYNVNNSCGLTFRQSSDGKLHLWWVDGIGTFNARSRKFTNPTTFSADYGSVTPIIPQGVIHLRIQDDGTNRIVSYSNDGFNWDAAFTIGRTDFLTADQVGFFISAQTTSSLCSIRLLSWEQS